MSDEVVVFDEGIVEVEFDAVKLFDGELVDDGESSPVSSARQLQSARPSANQGKRCISMVVL